MPVKFRGKFLNVGTHTQGVNGTATTTTIWGSACINCPSAIAHSTVLGGSLTVANVSNGDTVILTPAGSLSGGIVLGSACAIAGGISSSWVNTASVNQAASADVVVNYLVLQ